MIPEHLDWRVSSAGTWEPISRDTHPHGIFAISPGMTLTFEGDGTQEYVQLGPGLRGERDANHFLDSLLTRIITPPPVSIWQGLVATDHLTSSPLLVGALDTLMENPWSGVAGAAQRGDLTVSSRPLSETQARYDEVASTIRRRMADRMDAMMLGLLYGDGIDGAVRDRAR